MTDYHDQQTDGSLSESAARHILERAADMQRENQRRNESAGALTVQEASGAG